MEDERAETWIEVLSNVVAGLRSNETLSELAVQAREALAELRAQGSAAAGDEDDSEAAAGEEAAADDAEVAGAVDEDSAFDPDALAAKLDVLSASVEEMTDLLDAGLERLETLEMQLGDPDENADGQVAGTVQRCESRLAAIEHRLGAFASTLRDAAAQPDRRPGDGWNRAAERAAGPLLVLVVDGDSARRCGLCVALEHQGLHCSAVADVAGAAPRLAMQRPDAILIHVDTAPEEAVALTAMLEDFDSATPPAPAVMVVAQRPPGRMRAAAGKIFGTWPLVFSGEGEAALAAAVIAHTRPPAASDVHDPNTTEETT